jgi:hypothetical protein
MYKRNDRADEKNNSQNQAMVSVFFLLLLIIASAVDITVSSFEEFNKMKTKSRILGKCKI